MESRTESSPSRDLIQCCDCGCHSSPRSFHRSVKRRHDELEPQNHNLDGSSNPRVHIENECELLRETVASQQQSIQELYDELEKERCSIGRRRVNERDAEAAEREGRASDGAEAVQALRWGEDGARSPGDAGVGGSGEPEGADYNGFDV
ncbi:hypothetical protein Bca52824_025568 [Brassica carinata]|uniref:Uncharacterized protein n=1 Tax=Brassica carinata TaxID=52824 RepID=A0A8X7V727_BRACI|nr:hypothetical protein Bca52824_025568 [Brassica carinata]